jgi:hypothetical protein
MKEKEMDEGLELRFQTGRQKRKENIPGKNTHEDLDFLRGAGDTLERCTCEATGYKPRSGATYRTLDRSGE